MFTLAIVLCTLISHGFWWDKPLDVARPIILNLGDRAFGFLEGAEQFSSCRRITIPDWIGDTMPYTTRRDNLGERRFRNANQGLNLFIVIMVLIFGACHLIVWNWSFPFAIERDLWRTAALGCVIFPLSFSVSIVGLGLKNTGGTKAPIIPVIITAFYVLFRVYMIVEIFLGFAQLPREFISVYRGHNGYLIYEGKFDLDLRNQHICYT
jgi:hypothetical protein